MTVADLSAELFKNPFEDQPYGWVQWKGTDVCMDIHCECGAMSHVDGEFGYVVTCSECGKVYEPQGYVRLIPSSDSALDEHCTLRGSRGRKVYIDRKAAISEIKKLIQDPNVGQIVFHHEDLEGEGNRS